MKNPTSYRLSGVALSLIKMLPEKLGISQAGVIEMAVRQLADKEKVKISKVELK